MANHADVRGRVLVEQKVAQEGDFRPRFGAVLCGVGVHRCSATVTWLRRLDVFRPFRPIGQRAAFKNRVLNFVHVVPL